MPASITFEPAEGFAEPIGALSLRDAVRAGNRVLILVEDGTRRTPIPRLLQHVVAELQTAEIPEKSIAILIAPGTHREMTEDELKNKLGNYSNRFTIHQHRWLDESNLLEFGYTRDGN